MFLLFIFPSIGTKGTARSNGPTLIIDISFNIILADNITNIYCRVECSDLPKGIVVSLGGGPRRRMCPHGRGMEGAPRSREFWVTPVTGESQITTSEANKNVRSREKCMMGQVVPAEEKR